MATAWRNLDVKLRSASGNTTYLVNDGTYSFSAPVYDAQSRGALPTGISIQAIHSGAAIFDGSGSTATGVGAFWIQGFRDFQISGIQFQNWHNPEAGVFVIEAPNSAVQVFDNIFRSNGSSSSNGTSHTFYLSGGLSGSPGFNDGLQIVNNDIQSDVAGNGAALIHQYSGNYGGYTFRNSYIAGNKVRGTGWKWGILVDAAFGNPGNNVIEKNDIEGSFGDVVLRMYGSPSSGPGFDGMDSTTVFRANTFVQLGSGGMVRRDSTSGSAHQPTEQNNSWQRSSGGTGAQFFGWTPGSGDSIK